MKILACGPFLGDFEQEILTFRPYCKWLQEVVEHDVMYVYTHFNRFFLYDFVSQKNMIPIYEHISRDENKQNGYIHDLVNQKDYNLFLKNFKNDIIDIEGCNKKDIFQYNLNYIKLTPPYPLYNKIFEKISVKYVDEYKDKIVFIPHSNESERNISIIYKHLKNKYDCLIIGNNNIHFQYMNIINNIHRPFENRYKCIMEYINSAKAVICPTSFWTLLCNLQKVDVFSWGENVSIYKEDGVYNFDNKKSFIIPSNEETDINKVINVMDYFLNEL